jgi:hypothetical protein
LLFLKIFSFLHQIKGNQNLKIKENLLPRRLNLIMINTMWIKIYYIPIVLLILTTGCSNYKGTFAYKSVEMDHYEKLLDMREFEQNERIDWVFVPDTPLDEASIGVVYLQKKAVWIDINSRIAPVTILNPNVYGRLMTETPGEFQLQLIYKNEVQAALHYSVYAAEMLDPFEE